MAPRTSIQRFLLIFTVILCAAAPFRTRDNRANIRALTEPPSLPDLKHFSESLVNGNSQTLRGAYVADLFALPVVQQPEDQADYVSREPESLTQFEKAAEFGDIGLLAHNDLSGRLFPRIQYNQNIYLVYGDGRIETFIVIGTQKFQALSPFSIHSDFRNLETSKVLSAEELFQSVYMGPRHLTLQTCISENGNLSWGRLFVIAVPAAGLHPFTNHQILLRQ